MHLPKSNLKPRPLKREWTPAHTLIDEVGAVGFTHGRGTNTQYMMQ